MVKLIFENRDVLIGLVDWNFGARNVFKYGESAVNTIVIGRYLALLSHQIPSMHQLSSSSRRNCIGHSLGAHVCGFMGKTLNEKEFHQESRLYKIIGKYSVNFRYPTDAQKIPTHPLGLKNSIKKTYFHCGISMKYTPNSALCPNSM